ncbi:MAG: arylamine N-acetyltransferase [Rothia sp. (in: high G+C Gram-positive bacteria)]|uniref:arylamine N-acetyltransferase family protein n=1 Tax=Rothia sp. (in: high G+C Gram-positive bacteria) TaxID=1885016 RepID=UPI0026DACA1A|nr:arylamine N-acetyltransferase [Rothia sp. (in: high G+C Gram-positive bacteria)]MDO4883382.1 arylamine N-acetyltransferase [Rothia sp. (in: high G+C Gram-positive bacteria)]
MDAAQFEEYLRLTGFRPGRPNLKALRDLLTRHMAAFPFQTLSTVLGEPVPIDSGSIFHKLVAQRRGGYCYELNLLLLDALTLLGFEARPLTGSVIPNNRLEEAGARTHMLLQVTLEGLPWLVDAGFGGLAPSAPLRLGSEKTQLTPHGQYRLETRQLEPYRDGLVLAAITDDGPQLLYIFDRQPQRRIDLQVGNWFASTHPHSPLRTRLMAARTLPDGSRHTLLNARYTLHRPDGSRRVRTITDAASLLDVLRSRFALNLPQTGGLQRRLQQFLDTHGDEDAGTQCTRGEGADTESHV